jgi:putative SOS response-associated peptidase YedK
MINARSETIAGKPAYRSAFRRRRCLVPADGFFEWRKGVEAQGKKGPKTPFWIHRVDGEPFAMAGLWEKWAPEGGAPIFSFTIITTEAAPEIRDIHHRMPVILPVSAHGPWLDTSSSEADLLPLLRPRGGGLHAYPVSTLVNSPRNDVRECIDPV